MRKVFIKSGAVVAVSEIGAASADVTFQDSTSSLYVTDPAIDVEVGYTLVGAAYVAPPPRPPAPIADRRAARWEAIKTLRDLKTQTGGYTTGGKWFHSDIFSRTQQIGLVLMGAGVPGGLLWKTMDGSFVTMTATLAGQVFAAAAANDQALFTHAETLHAAVNAATDPASINITTGWPASYLGSV